MSGNPRENISGKGFWDGGASSHGKNTESSGRPSGYPGSRKPARQGVKTDLEFPPEEDTKKAK